MQHTTSDKPLAVTKVLVHPVGGAEKTILAKELHREQGSRAKGQEGVAGASPRAALRTVKVASPNGNHTREGGMGNQEAVRAVEDGSRRVEEKDSQSAGRVEGEGADTELLIVDKSGDACLGWLGGGTSAPTPQPGGPQHACEHLPWLWSGQTAKQPLPCAGREGQLRQKPRRRLQE